MASQQNTSAHDHDHVHDHAHGHDCETHRNMKKYTATELIVRTDIMAKAQELAALISTSDEVKFFRKAEKQVQGNSEIQDLIKLLKKRQKEAVAFESFQNEKMVTKINGEIDELQDKLDNYPIVTQFKQAQEDINYLLQLVVGVIRDTVSDKIQVEDATAAETDSDSNCSD
ncbi:MAG: hypothetical protein K0Q59_3121 [Paenibacillus sp.]|nr:hypothetical protein [Paenibacillus sp.]